MRQTAPAANHVVATSDELGPHRLSPLVRTRPPMACQRIDDSKPPATRLVVSDGAYIAQVDEHRAGVGNLDAEAIGLVADGELDGRATVHERVRHEFARDELRDLDRCVRPPRAEKCLDFSARLRGAAGSWREDDS